MATFRTVTEDQLNGEYPHHIHIVSVAFAPETRKKVKGEEEILLRYHVTDGFTGFRFFQYGPDATTELLIDFLCKAWGMKEECCVPPFCNKKPKIVYFKNSIDLINGDLLDFLMELDVDLWINLNYGDPKEAQ